MALRLWALRFARITRSETMRRFQRSSRSLRKSRKSGVRYWMEIAALVCADGCMVICIEAAEAVAAPPTVSSASVAEANRVLRIVILLSFSLPQELVHRVLREDVCRLGLRPMLGKLVPAS